MKFLLFIVGWFILLCVAPVLAILLLILLPLLWLLFLPFRLLYILLESIISLFRALLLLPLLLDAGRH